MNTNEYNKLIEKAHERCIKELCSLRHTFNITSGKLKGVLFGENGSVYVRLDEENENNIKKVHYIVSFDDKLHGNTRNFLAKKFCEKYTLEQLQEEYLQELQRKFEIQKQEEFKRKQDTDFFNVHFSDFKKHFKYGEMRISRIICGTVLNYKYHSLHDGDYNYKGLMFDIEINRITKNEFKAEYTHYDEHVGKTDNFNGNYSELIQYLEKVGNEINSAVDELIAERTEIDRQRLFEYHFKTKCYKIVNDKEHTYIFKTTKGSFNVHHGLRWSNKGEGKFYRIDGDKLYKMLSDKKITTYAIINGGLERQTHDILNTLVFIPIMENT